MQEIHLVNQALQINQPKDLFDYLVGATTPLIALLAAFFAFCQWRTYQKQYRAMITDRIVKNYEKLSKAQGYIIKHGNIDFEHFRLLALALDEARVCLSPELVEYLKAIYSKAGRLLEIPDLINEKKEQIEEVGIKEEEKSRLIQERKVLHDEKSLLLREFIYAEHYKIYRKLLVA